MVSASAALVMMSATEDNPQGEHIAWPILVAWTFFLGALGTLLAIPMKRNMINQERLKFPSGTAAAVTLQSLFSEGIEAAKKAKALLWSAICGAVFPILIEFQMVKKATVDPVTGDVGYEPSSLMPSDYAVFDHLGVTVPGTHLEGTEAVANEPSHWTMVWDNNPVMIAAGALVGMRVAIYMTLGALLLVYGVGPQAHDWLWVSPAGDELRAASQPWKAWKEIGIWLGVPIMVSSGLLSFAFQYKTILRAFTSLVGTKTDQGELEAVIQRTEVPISWFIWGSLFAGLGVVTVAQVYFEVPFIYGILAVLMTFALALVACRATGETDITPVGAMGKIMQLTYGVLIPQSTTANLMTASITASSAGSAADLLNDLKSGYLLGANPRRQFIAQFAGIFSGTIATVVGFYLLVPDATALNGVGDKAPDFPAPAAQAWRAVAEVFQMGLGNMHPMHRQAIFWGLGIGVVLLLLEKAMPKAKKYLPSATGIGLGLILPFQYPLSMLIGATIAWAWTRKNKEQCDEYLVPIAAGVIAGISLMGVLGAVLNTLVFTA
jgi:uncharacterized oligopeptide transporter (OPT) family protein